MSEVVYLYGFVPSNAPAPPPEVSGPGGAAVRLLDVDGLRAAVSHLPASEFGAEPIEAKLQDLAWVGEQGLAHERVVVWFTDHAEILPARMFSIYSGEEALRQSVRADVGSLQQALRSLAGMREWNLKVGYDADELARHGTEISEVLRRADEEIAGAPPGRRYLLERRRAELLKAEVSRAARTLAEELLQALRVHAGDARVLPVTAADDSGSIVLNAALLVSRDAEQALREQAGDLHRRYTALGMIVSFSGPWAPYRFVEQYGVT